MKQNYFFEFIFNIFALFTVVLPIFMFMIIVSIIGHICEFFNNGEVKDEFKKKCV